MVVPLSPKKRKTHETESVPVHLLLSKLAHTAFITGYESASWPSREPRTTHTQPCAWGHQVPCCKNKVLTWKGLESTVKLRRSHRETCSREARPATG